MSDIKVESWTDRIHFGRPNREKNFVNTLTIVFAFIILSGIAPGNIVETHMIVNKY